MPCYSTVSRQGPDKSDRTTATVVGSVLFSPLTAGTSIDVKHLLLPNLMFSYSETDNIRHDAVKITVLRLMTRRSDSFPLPTLLIAAH